ncbi:non-ribosomal peptide synthetase [Streptomyces sp. NBC_00893]|uniref:non-ribosomal peptide synthetase n=1 Tax=Streptomyces sp. NBC_00893 TaxID=2975862 RepID=UPI002254C1F8|nr:non-ribosomal peptide synthetase [Streptomyces sp. NBC_00893]MCX4850520.1 non-ribosomal peptide synthetase [Streptomyces sp. NBC_00893]
MEANESEAVDVADAVLAAAHRHPERPALAAGSESWTYAELTLHARRVERCLRDRGVRAGDVVAVQGRRSPRVVAALLGVLLADAAYLALGENVPAARLRHMLAEAAPRAVLAEESADQELFRHGGSGAPAVVTHDEARGHEPAPERHTAPAERGDLPAYLVHTSGTTGVPKGVVIARRSLAAHRRAVHELFELVPEDRVLQASSLAFDVAAEEIWPTLAAGALVDILPTGLGDVSYDRLTRVVHGRGITVCNLPASYFSGWAAHLDESGTALPTLRLVVTGSEELPVEAARDWCSAGRPRLVHAYGVSEATITSVACEVTPDMTAGERVPIGAPLPGVRTVVADERDTPVLAGTEGQLLIGGPGVALGYLGTDPLPEGRFLRGSVPGAGQGPWYRTGDWVREERGLLHFLGRVDDQLKVNGVRVEPGEVAAVLAAQPAVTDAKVFRIGETLVGCVCTPHPVDRAYRDSTTGRLRAVLPPAMVPAEILGWDAFPLTEGGKVDVRALRAAATARLDGGTVPVGAADVRTVLRRLWQDVLGAPEVGADSDFFALGGGSLSAARLSSALLRETGVTVKLRTLFAHPRFDDYLQQVELASDRRA